MRGLRKTAGYGALLVHAVLLSATLAGQELRRHSPSAALCSAIQIHLSAKRPDGSPFRFLRAQDLHVSFREGPAKVVSVTSAARATGPDGTANVLFVIPPFAAIGEREIASVLRPLARADSFRFRAMVLDPSGALSSPAGDLHSLKDALRHGISQKAEVNRAPDRWLQAEQEAFLTLRRERGLHVIVRLALPQHSRPGKQSIFVQDTSMDLDAATDLAEIYRLLAPVRLSETIPMGDAATEHIDGAPDTLGIEQRSQVQAASQHQAAVWAARDLWTTHTAGGAEDSAELLMQDVIQNLAASYTVTVQPQFSCPGVGFRSIAITTEVRDVRLFAPSAIQMVPLDDLNP
jgi:hypothetical protein